MLKRFIAHLKLLRSQATRAVSFTRLLLQVHSIVGEVYTPFEALNPSRVSTFDEFRRLFCPDLCSSQVYLFCPELGVPADLPGSSSNPICLE